MSATRAAVRLDNLSVTGAGGDLVRGVSLQADPGRTLAIVGESGSGKSLTARALTGLLPAGLHATGHVQLGATQIDVATADERVWRGVRGRGIALLLQDPFTSLAPVRRIGTQIADTVRAHSGARLGRAELRAAVIERLDEVRLPTRVARQYPHELSGGMRQRAAIAAALAANPMVLVADEPTTALDASTQDDVLALINGLRSARAMAVILISHDLELVRGHADTIEVMFGGSVVERGPAAAVLSGPLHPYTAGLLASSPSITRRIHRLPERPWLPVDQRSLPDGASFGNGYATAEAVRAVAAPTLIAVGDGRAVGVYGIGSTAPEVQPLPATPPSPVTLAPPTTATQGTAVTVTGLRKRFGHNTVLDDVSVTIQRGEIFGLVGESGSGKTTLARCLVGLEEPDAGSIHPMPPDHSGTHRVSRGRTRGGTQIVFQDPASALNPGLTIGTTLREALRAAGDKHADPADLLRRVGLPTALLRRRPGSLSGGQQQRVAIARALALKPEVLVCDESVSALDVSVQAQILSLVTSLRDREHLSIVFISHDLGVIHQIADRVAVLHRGAIVEQGSPEHVLHSPIHPYTVRLVAAARGNATTADGPARRLAPFSEEAS